MRRTRVAFVLPHFRPGGAERCVLNWIGALDRAAFAPLLLLGQCEGAFLDALSIDVPVMEIGGGRALTRPWRIARALHRERIDLAYSATSAMNLALLAAPTRVPRIVSEHTPPDAYLAEAKWRAGRFTAMRLLYPRAAAVAAPTQAIADALAGRLPRIATRVLPNPVIGALPPLPPFTDSRRIVAAGRLVPAKGFDRLIDAVALLPDVTLDIYGEGPEQAALAARIAATGARARLMGHRDPLAREIAGAALFVLPSRREGFGNVLIEAMAAGVPVLATRAGGPETFVADGVNGFLADDPAPRALAGRIAALLADAPACDAVRGPARDTAARFSIAASTAAFAALAARLTAI